MELALFLAARLPPPRPPKGGSASGHQCASQTLDPEVGITCSRPTVPLKCPWR